LENSIQNIKKLEQLIAQKTTEILYYYIQIGGQLKKIKEWCGSANSKIFFDQLSKNQLNYKKSLAYFLIKTYEKAEQHPEIQHLKFSLHYCMKNWINICLILDAKENHIL